MSVSRTLVYWVLFVSFCESGTSKYVSNIQNPPNGVKARKPIPIVSKTFIFQSDLAVRDRGCLVIVFVLVRKLRMFNSLSARIPAKLGLVNESMVQM